MMIKRLIQEEDVTIVNTCAPIRVAHQFQYIKQILITTKGEISSNLITVQNFNTPIFVNRSVRQKINKETRP